MITLLFDLLCVAYAAEAISTAWFYGGIFENLRKTMEKREGKLGQLLGCPLCFSYHPPWILLLLFVFPSLFLNDTWAILSKLPVYSLAITSIHRRIFGLPEIDDDEEEKEEYQDPTRE